MTTAIVPSAGVQFADLSRQYHTLHKEIDAAVARVLKTGKYILGEEVAAFEREFAQYVGVAHGVGVASGTDAIEIALRACGIAPGDEVITVSHTAVATVCAIEACGARPVFSDVDPLYYTIDPAHVAELITSRTRAIVPVHLYGHPADLTPLLELGRRHDLRVVEDCAQAHGAWYRDQRVGAWGDAAAFSFYPTKNLGAVGDGGMVVSPSHDVAHRARLLREYGWTERYSSSVKGLNSRLDEIQAAILRVKLRTLDMANASRVEIAATYSSAFAANDLAVPITRAGSRHVFHLYVIRSSARDALRAHLASRGIGTNVHYPVPVHLQPAYRADSARRHLPVTEQIAGEVLSLPMFPGLSQQEVDQVVEAVAGFDA